MFEFGNLVSDITRDGGHRLNEMEEHEVVPHRAEERELLLAALRAQTAQTLSRTLGVGGYDAYMKGHGRQFTNSLSVPVTRARANPSGAEVIKVK